jgi:hypothetical protein
MWTGGLVKALITLIMENSESNGSHIILEHAFLSLNLIGDGCDDAL